MIFYPVFMLLALLLVGWAFPSYGQIRRYLCLEVSDPSGEAIDSVQVWAEGETPLRLPASRACFRYDPKRKWRVSAEGYGVYALNENLDALGERDTLARIMFIRSEKELETVEIEGDRTGGLERGHLNDVSGMGLYAAKKTEVLHVQQLAANLSVNLGRQIYAQIPGLNIWDTDGGGLQLSFGARGLDPNRLSSFNVRQNGYDVSADALGYPESYYTPPAEALERIEVVRGAAALQFGPQFGGMVNQVFRRGKAGYWADVNLRQTVGSFGLGVTSVGVGGQISDDVLYYNFLQYKKSEGWRPNEHLESLTGFTAVDWRLGERWKAALEFSHLHYLAQQPGGLTDAQFERDPSVSVRARNWFRVQWLLPAFTLEYKPDDRQAFELRTFGLVASRDALGNLERIHVMDLPGNRTLIADQYRNIGAELRYLSRFDVLKRWPAALLTGVRLYRGRTHQQQGEADAGSGPTFEFAENAGPNVADYRNPGDNLSAFAETVIHLTERWKMAPGVRYEAIFTRSDGYYQFTLRDMAGSVVAVSRTHEFQRRERSILLGGLGVSHRTKRGLEAFGNFTLNYRPITFSDLRIQNPNFVIDPNLQDERGWNADLGARGAVGRWLRFDASLFLLAYNNRIGEALRADQAPLYLPYRYRTNIGRSLAQGLESYLEWEPTALLKRAGGLRLVFFVNASWTKARYQQSNEPAVEGKRVEYAPECVARAGAALHWSSLRIGVQHHYTSEQFADATNARFSANASIGQVPAYSVTDVSLRWQRKRWAVDAGCNNVFNRTYYTRRAVSYPGPGILPSPPRTWYVGLEWNWKRARG